ncbi:MAG TPA: hypothetical protein VJX74_06535 [Blastocatellia bacterium]|nr:hypothetical protein [Blastocatellia bacterium]
MKLAVFSESLADEAAIRIVVEAILGIQTEIVTLPSLRTRGWPSVRNVLPSVLKDLHYHKEAEAFVLVVDSDNSPVHQNSHELNNNIDKECRVCLLRTIINQTFPNRMPLKIAVGLAIPAIEAWYRCGVDPHSTEAMLIQKLGAPARELKNQLKRDVYGTDRPSLKLETRRAIEEATRLIQNLDMIERLFPDGFGTLARDVRSWRQG